ncbi:MAG: lysylphosphatidylglycerol synthase transmembrane domain-containing protein [Myxococcota bacterium]|nr:lysylphosphatidylglycerol synthase transmembrane domain-containing protein [Myxococcota bacterium]
MEPDPQPQPVNPIRRWLRWILPFAVSIALLSWLFARTDFTGVVDKVDIRILLIMIPALLLYGAFSLWVEAQSLMRVMASSGQPVDAVTCARAKAASYLYAIVHYTVGAGVLAVLLKRRTQIRLADTTGAVAFISVLDLIVLLFIAALGGALLASREPALQLGLVLGGVAVLVGGFAFLRAPIPLGNLLERVRDFALFRAVRTTPLPTLLELIGFRFLFVTSFMGIAVVALLAFHIHIPLGDMVVGFTAVSLIAALPIAVSGLGTGQATWLFVFRHWSDPETLLASSLVLSLGLILLRAGMGVLFAHELTREALDAAREVDA